MVRSRFKKPVRLAVLVIKSGEKNCESWCFKEIIGIGFMVDEKWFGDDYLIINEAIFLSEIKSYRLRSCLCILTNEELDMLLCISDTALHPSFRTCLKHYQSLDSDRLL